MIPDDEGAEKHSLNSAGKTNDFGVQGLMQKDTGLNQVDEEVNLVPTEFKRRFKKRAVVGMESFSKTQKCCSCVSHL